MYCKNTVELRSLTASGQVQVPEVHIRWQSMSHEKEEDQLASSINKYSHKGAENITDTYCSKTTASKTKNMKFHLLVFQLASFPNIVSANLSVWFISPWGEPIICNDQNADGWGHLGRQSTGITFCCIPDLLIVSQSTSDDWPERPLRSLPNAGILNHRVKLLNLLTPTRLRKLSGVLCGAHTMSQYPALGRL